MKLFDLFRSLRDSQLRLQLVGEQLKIIGDPNAITDDILLELRERKQEIIAFFKKRKIGFNSISCTEKRQYYMLSSAENGVFLLQEKDINSVAYNLPRCFFIGNSIDIARITHAFIKLINRHENLRSCFKIHDGKPVKCTVESVEFEIPEHKVEYGGIDAVMASFVRPFDLAMLPLFRVALVKEEKKGYFLLIDMHHIISDGLSHEIMRKELLDIYNGISQPALKLQYKDFSVWERSAERQLKLKEQGKYWLKKFSDDIQPTDLPIDFKRSANQMHEGASVYFQLPEQMANALKLASKQTDTSLYVLFFSIFALFISRICRSQDVIIGTPVTTRSHADLDGIVGMFVNMLAVRTSVDKCKTFKEFILQQREILNESFENCDFPFQELVENIAVERNPARHPVFNAVFTYSELSDKDIFSGPTFNVHCKENVRFELCFGVNNYKDAIVLNIAYATSIFKSQTIDRFIEWLKQIACKLPTHINEELRHVDLLSEAERNQILHSFNNSSWDNPHWETLHSLFEYQTTINADKIALICKDRSISYEKLNELANRLANYLTTNYMIATNDRVAVKIDRSEWIVIAILGILKSGAAYVPIDPSYPEERVDYIIADSQCKAVIDNITLEQFWDKHDTYLASNPVSRNTAADLAYVIYTSGSTGRPKGAGVFHRGIVNLVLWYQREFSMTSADRNIIISSPGFDLTQKNFFGTLISGGTIVMPAMSFYDSRQISQCIKEELVTIINCAPNAFYPLADEAASLNNLRSLRLVVLGGESINIKRLEKWISSEGYDCEIVNSYGPTECTDIAAYYRIREPLTYIDRNIPIGKPNDNVQLFVLNEDRQLQPIGIPGELYIAGHGVGAGYLNDKALTALKFSNNLFGEGILYRTGDLVRWLADGNIEFLGRFDDQVNIRGYRIELGEIIQVLRTHPYVVDCVIKVWDNEEDKYLCAYIVSSVAFIEADMRAFLLKKLPAYMVPQYFVSLFKLPLTANGKINIQGLPQPQRDVLNEIVPPSSDIEKKLVDIWSELLGLDKAGIGVKNNFFELGGHSLKIIKMRHQVKKELGVNIAIEEIFDAPTVELLAKNINRKKWILENKNLHTQDIITTEI